MKYIDLIVKEVEGTNYLSLLIDDKIAYTRRFNITNLIRSENARFVKLQLIRNSNVIGETSQYLYSKNESEVFFGNPKQNSFMSAIDEKTKGGYFSVVVDEDIDSLIEGDILRICDSINDEKPIKNILNNITLAHRHFECSEFIVF